MATAGTAPNPIHKPFHVVYVKGETTTFVEGSDSQERAASIASEKNLAAQDLQLEGTYQVMTKGESDKARK